MPQGKRSQGAVGSRAGLLVGRTFSVGLSFLQKGILTPALFYTSEGPATQLTFHKWVTIFISIAHQSQQQLSRGRWLTEVPVGLVLISCSARGAGWTSWALPS